MGTLTKKCVSLHFGANMNWLTLQNMFDFRTNWQQLVIRLSYPTSQSAF